MPPATPISPKTELLSRVADCAREWPFKMWGFGEGIALRGLLAASRALDREEHSQFVHDLLKTSVDRGVGEGNEDHIAPGTELLLMYEERGDEAFLDAAKGLAELNASFPRNRFGARMHRPDLSGWRRQIWVDCMDVDGPFLVRLAQLTGDGQYREQGLQELLGYARALQIEEEGEALGLFWHGYEVDCGANGQLWARGNGWALMGIVETLKLLPAKHEDRPELLERLTKLCQSLRAFQQRSGLWSTVITEPDTYEESTLAVMAAFALREAFQAELLDEREFGNMESGAREGAIKCINEAGGLELVSDATPVGELNMYATRPFGVFPWGQGPLLLMLSQEFI